ncbi:MAG: LuxR C-terminal-related transcriptional regulator, partial [Tunicatimonas sp.]|uniref:helix-turn-helix transcriptional regulator n=1 Tax=Tunicatimonas sp. TaxID=1940096 RepID=UPI003C767BE5
SSIVSDAEQRTYINLLIFFQAGVGLTLIIVPIAISIYRNQAMVKRLNHRNNYIQVFQDKLRTQKPSSEANAKNFEKQLLLKFPYLTAHDLKICSFLIQNYSSKEIAEELNITPGSVNTARYRLRKKMNLPKEIDLIIYLNKIA